MKTYVPVDPHQGFFSGRGIDLVVLLHPLEQFFSERFYFPQFALVALFLLGEPVTVVVFF